MHTIGGIAGIRECGGLSENGPHRLMYLNTWSSIGGTVWEGLVGVALLEEMYYWEWVLRFQELVTSPVSSVP